MLDASAPCLAGRTAITWNLADVHAEVDDWAARRRSSYGGSMRSMDCALALVAISVSVMVPLGCTRSAPASATTDGAVPLSVFPDSAVYRRFCVVPAGRPIDVTKPCLLLDQGRQPVSQSSVPFR